MLLKEVKTLDITLCRLHNKVIRSLRTYVCSTATKRGLFFFYSWPQMPAQCVKTNQFSYNILLPSGLQVLGVDACERVCLPAVFFLGALHFVKVRVKSRLIKTQRMVYESFCSGVRHPLGEYENAQKKNDACATGSDVSSRFSGCRSHRLRPLKKESLARIQILRGGA